MTQLGDTRLYTSFAPSPDARFLLVAWLERPFSYNVPCGRFPKRVQLWDRCSLAVNSARISFLLHSGLLVATCDLLIPLLLQGPAGWRYCFELLSELVQLLLICAGS